MGQLIDTLFNGLSASSIILLTTIGLAITFGLMKVINMAHGEFLMIGAYTTYMVQSFFVKYFPESVFDLYYFMAIIVSFVVTFIFGCILERLVVSRLYGREVDSLLATFGISLVLQQLARSLFGSQGVYVTSPGFLTGGIRAGKNVFSYNRLFIILLVALCILMVWIVMYKLNFGKQMRATMQNRDMAMCIGINSKRVDMMTFAMGSGLAGIAGCAVALLGSVDSTVGQSYIVNSFMAVVLGGVGNIAGTVIGSIIIGFLSIIFEGFMSSSIAKAVVLIIIILFLQKKPQGMFALRSRALDE